MAGRLPVFLRACGCHAACPLAGRFDTSRATWQRDCTCPGQARRASEGETRAAPDFAEFRRRARQERATRAAARDEAFTAVRAVADGKTRAQIRELYEAELRTRGLPVPPGPLLDDYADAIAGHARPGRLAAHALASISKDIGELRKILRNVAVFRPDD